MYTLYLQTFFLYIFYILVYLYFININTCYMYCLTKTQKYLVFLQNMDT